VENSLLPSGSDVLCAGPWIVCVSVPPGADNYAKTVELALAHSEIRRQYIPDVGYENVKYPYGKSTVIGKYNMRLEYAMHKCLARWTGVPCSSISD